MPDAQASLFGAPPADPSSPTTTKGSERRNDNPPRTLFNEALSQEALWALDSADVGESHVRLQALLSPETYEEIADVLKRLGGRWRSAGKAADDGVPRGRFVFEHDPRPLLEAVIQSGCKPAKNPTAYFPTPPDVVKAMLEMAGVDLLRFAPEARILEPSAGSGAIADALRESSPGACLDTVEILPINAAVLRAKGHVVHEMDFLQFEADASYDAVLMNPPFSLPGDPLAYVTHIEHAWSMLAEHGVLVAIAPNSLLERDDDRIVALRTLIWEMGGEIAMLPRKSFAAAGTTVDTVMIFARKEDTAWKERPYEGYPSWHAWSADLYASNDHECYQQKERIWERLGRADAASLRKRVPETITGSIRRYYSDAAGKRNAEGDAIRLSDSDFQMLCESFVREYLIENSHAEAPDSGSVAAAA